MVYLALPETCYSHPCFVLGGFYFLLLFIHFSVREGGGRVWVVSVVNAQPEKQQLLIMDEFHGTQKVKERRNIKE